MKRVPNKERIQLWVDALEGGGFLQGRGALAVSEGDKTGYCCLGVATYVALVTEPLLMPAYLGASEPCVPSLWGWLGEMPDAVADWFGLSNDPELLLESLSNGLYGNVKSATCCNDSIGLSFAEIALAIRNTYLDGENEGERT